MDQLGQHQSGWKFDQSWARMAPLSLTLPGWGEGTVVSNAFPTAQVQIVFDRATLENTEALRQVRARVFEATEQQNFVVISRSDIQRLGVAILNITFEQLRGNSNPALEERLELLASIRGALTNKLIFDEVDTQLDASMEVNYPLGHRQHQGNCAMPQRIPGFQWDAGDEVEVEVETEMQVEIQRQVEMEQDSFDLYG